MELKFLLGLVFLVLCATVTVSQDAEPEEAPAVPNTDSDDDVEPVPGVSYDQNDLAGDPIPAEDEPGNEDGSVVPQTNDTGKTGWFIWLLENISIY